MAHLVGVRAAQLASASATESRQAPSRTMRGSAEEQMFFSFPSLHDFKNQMAGVTLPAEVSPVRN